jgi:HEAT repeat protein
LDNDTLKREYLNYLKWTESIALMLGLPEINQNLAVKIVEQALDVDLMLGARLAGQARREVILEAINLINKTIIQFDMPDWLQVDLFQSIRSDLVVSYLVKKITGSNREIWQQFSWAIKVIGLENSIQSLIPLLNHESIELVLHIYSTILELKDDKFIDLILKNNPYNKKLDICLERFSHEPFARCVVFLKPFPPMPSNVIFDDPVPARILNAISDRNECFLSGSTIMALGNYRKAVPILVGLTTDVDPMVRRQSVSALSKLKDRDGFESIKLLCEDSESHVKAAAFYALGEMGFSVPIDVLRKGMKDLDLNVRKSAIHASFRSDSHEIISELQLAFDDCESDMAWNILSSIRDFHTSQESSLLLWLFSYRFTEKGKAAFMLISHIQSNCKFYNYEIFHSSPANPQFTQQSRGPVTYHISQVGNLNTGTVNIHGNQNGEQ